MRLKDRVAIETGAARGLGRSFALKLAQEGAKVMAMNIVLRPKDREDLDFALSVGVDWVALSLERALQQ